ncbi:carboxymuconolactone decarboxylase family protein [Sphaerisporangium aureirubrum]|uniref:Carboxymuconolactone decarboxylase family protein n=1 Tax=Sphaerisporangium aureirubrum TaxID=1544736 RepID=A0ABW1NI73_9ACTN
MTYLTTPAESPLYPSARDAMGYVPNYLRVLALCPGVHTAWLHLSETVRDGMDLRRYELVTLTAARRLGSTYCALAHASVLRGLLRDDAAWHAVVTGDRGAGLSPADVAVMDFAGRVAADPVTVSEADIGLLREHALTDADILQIVVAVCLRRFFSGILSATGAIPDAIFDDLPSGIRAALESPAGP